MSTDSIVSKVWGFCTILRDDGVGYGGRTIRPPPALALPNNPPRPLMAIKQDLPILFDTLGVAEQIDESPKLAKWARGYATQAEAAGALGFDWYLDTPPDWPAAATIRLICTLWPYCEWADWLSWQQFQRPTGRGPWWVTSFSTPWEWSDATMYLRDPWDYPFSHLFMADHSGPIEFDLHTRRSIRLSNARHRWLAGAIYDGLFYDFDESEFILACSRKARSLKARIWYPSDLPEYKDLHLKKDRHGIYWSRRD